jgi:hypothetical protein
MPPVKGLESQLEDNMHDYTFENHFSIWLVRSNTTDAQEHLESHVSADATWFGDALVVEPRYVSDLAVQLGEDGFTVGV